MERKSYSGSKQEIVFDIDGEEFRARKMPGALFIDFQSRAATADEQEMAGLLRDAFIGCFEEAEFERFWKRCSMDVDIETMTQILTDLASASVGERPTVPPSPSAPGRRRAQAAAGSSARVRTIPDSTSGNSAT